MTPHLIAIAAMARNRVIGNKGKLPWERIPEDMAHFRETTWGRFIIMGRKTWESIGSKSLTGRHNIVLCRTPVCDAATLEPSCMLSPEWVTTVGFRDTVYVIGGAQTYAALMPWTQEILLTVLDFEADGDTYFPEIGPEFELISTTPLSERAVVQRWVRKEEA